MDFVELLKATTDGGVIAILAVMIVIGAVIILPAFLKTLKEQRTELTEALNGQRHEFTLALKESHEKCDRMMARAEDDHRRTSEAINQLSANIHQLTFVVQTGMRPSSLRTRDGEIDG